MATRTPLILNQTSARVEELAVADSIPGALIDGLIGRNRLINGSMRWWQRGTSFTSPGYSADRWYFNAGGVNTPSLSRSGVALGQVNTECLYYAKVAYGTITDAANHYVVFEQRLPDVTTLAGRTVTVSFLVFNGGAVGRQIAVELGQSFGVGGSAQVSGIGSAKYSLTAGINYITHTVQVPSISGKTVGPNSSLVLTLWATGGSNFNTRNASLGAQTGDVHFTQVQVEGGASATAFDYVPDTQELLLCQRYYFKSESYGVGSNYNDQPFFIVPLVSNNRAVGGWRFPVRMRTKPALSTFNPNDSSTNSVHCLGVDNPAYASIDYDANGITQVNFGGSRTAGQIMMVQIAADAEL